MLLILAIDHGIDQIMYVFSIGPLELPFLTLIERLGWKFSRNDGFRQTPSFGALLRQIKEIVQECVDTHNRPRFVLLFTTKKLALNPREQARYMPSFLMRDDTHKVRDMIYWRLLFYLLRTKICCICCRLTTMVFRWRYRVLWIWINEVISLVLV